MKIYLILPILLISFCSFAETLSRDATLSATKNGAAIFTLRRGTEVAPKLLKILGKKIEVSIRIRMASTELSGKYGTVIRKGTAIMSIDGKTVGKFLKKFDSIDTDKKVDGEKILAIKGYIDRSSIVKKSFVELDLINVLKKKKSPNFTKLLASHISKFGYGKVGEQSGVKTYMLMDKWAYTMSPDPRIVLYVHNNELVAVVSTIVIRSKSFLKITKLDNRYHMGLVNKISPKIKPILDKILSILLRSG